eukprot:scaffold230119_cov19-Prasinocladus_malaysianus.AAC.1
MLPVTIRRAISHADCPVHGRPEPPLQERKHPHAGAGPAGADHHRLRQRAHEGRTRPGSAKQYQWPAYASKRQAVATSEASLLAGYSKWLTRDECSKPIIR